MENKIYHITTRSIIIFISILLSLYLAYMIVDVLLLLFLSFTLAIALDPFVEFFVGKGLPRGLSAVIVTVTVAFALVVVLYISFDPLLKQVVPFFVAFPTYISQQLNIGDSNQVTEQLVSLGREQLTGISNNVVSFTVNAVSFMVTTLFVFALTLYILVDFLTLKSSFIKLFSKHDKRLIQKMVRNIERKMGAWVRGQLVMMFIVGLITYFGLVLLGVNYAIALAVVAGLLEVIPIIGPVLAVIPAALLGFAISPITGIGVLGLYILVQQTEYNIIAPKVMERAVGQNPIVTMIAILVGGNLFGIIGAIIAVPFAVVLTEVINYYRSKWY